MQKGFIFKCTNKSESECLKRQLFGTDRLAADEVLSLQPGDKLFLLNVESDKLFGIFEARTSGGLELVREAWKGRYPYQIEVQPVGEVRQLVQGKEILSTLKISSHQFLCNYEVDALNTLFPKNGHAEHSLVLRENTQTLVKELARQLELFHKEKDCNVRNEKPIIELTTLWDYPTQSYGRNPKGNNKYAGVTPAFIIYNLIKRYTALGDVVLDPMCGSGTTLDVCNEEGRRAICYDIVSVRPDIMENDARSIPLANETVDMVFIDSPYGDNIKYNTSPKNIGNLSAETEEFYDELEKVMKEAYRVMTPSKVLGWLIGDQCENWKIHRVRRYVQPSIKLKAINY